jgi:hypothetical protein
MARPWGWALSINWPSRKRGWSVARICAGAARPAIGPIRLSAHRTIFPTQSVIFGSTGSATVAVGAGPMLQDSWTFLANSQSCTISGNPVDFSPGGPIGGLINNANAGQTISITNNINGAVSGVYRSSSSPPK